MTGWFNMSSVPDDVYKVIKDEHEEFQRALGKLTLGWADMEKVIRITLRHYAGVTPEVARALFSGTRAKTAMDMIESIAHNTDMEKARIDDLREVFPVISSINTMRDFLVHYVDGSLIESDDNDPRLRKLSNRGASSRVGKGKTYWISSALIYDMCHDLTECCWRLLAHREATNNTFQRGYGASGAPAPWRYKHPQPAPADK
ncbi:hypothetical protein G7048_24780 [Diaphorobacter sp. HDW4B]|uniref:hypothetical protein n=1 Tax=Diaphorobacter sp. HDW4B TaxID=2714925 RepID=UPI0014076332|nr:hypothetical protein [Diaphorobacter sp. HDW4B]QIL73279.1 hypothetical protein G7048_24780 [Diaphorobacter sp. HDW4B]